MGWVCLNLAGERHGTQAWRLVFPGVGTVGGQSPGVRCPGMPCDKALLLVFKLGKDLRFPCHCQCNCAVFFSGFGDKW